MRGKDSTTWCSLCGNSRKKDPGKMFHIFPIDAERAKLWITGCNIRRLFDKTPEYLHKNCKLCADHFEPRMYVGKRLKQDAVPTLNLNAKNRQVNLNVLHLTVFSRLQPCTQSLVKDSSDSCALVKPLPNVTVSAVSSGLQPCTQSQVNDPDNACEIVKPLPNDTVSPVSSRLRPCTQSQITYNDPDNACEIVPDNPLANLTIPTVPSRQPCTQSLSKAVDHAYARDKPLAKLSKPVAPSSRQPCTHSLAKASNQSQVSVKPLADSNVTTIPSIGLPCTQSLVKASNHSQVTPLADSNVTAISSIGQPCTQSLAKASDHAYSRGAQLQNLTLARLGKKRVKPTQLYLGLAQQKELLTIENGLLPEDPTNPSVDLAIPSSPSSGQECTQSLVDDADVPQVTPLTNSAILPAPSRGPQCKLSLVEVSGHAPVMPLITCNSTPPPAVLSSGQRCKRLPVLAPVPPLANLIIPTASSSGQLCTQPLVEDAGTHLVSVAPLANLTTRTKPRRKRIISPQSKEIYTLRRALQRLKVRYTNCLNGNVNIGKKKRKDIIHESLKNLATVLPPKLHCFLKSQILNSITKPSGRRWSSFDKALSLSVYLESPSAYSALQQFLVLPCKSSLERA